MNDVVVIFGLQDPNIKDQDVEVLAEKHKQYESARRLIFSLVSSRGGRLIGQIHGDEVVTLPHDQASIVKEIHKRMWSDCHIPATIGVGEDSEQALIALNYAREKAPMTIKVYDHEMDQGEKPQPLHVAVGEQDRVEKTSKYVPVSEEDKQAIAQVLAQVQQSKDLFAQLQQQSPDVYAGIVSVVQSLTGILKEDKQAQDEHIADMIGKINDHLGRQHGKQNVRQAKEMQREIDRQSKPHEKEKDEKRRQMFANQTDLRKQKMEDAEAHANATGHHNPKFLFRMLKAFEK